MESTYVFSDGAEELARLINQERVLNDIMGGALSGIPDGALLHNVLDLACGAGGWGLDVAFHLPLAEVAGIDINPRMIKYAFARAQSQELTNATFEAMDITKPIDFSSGSFDLVNARLLFAAIKREAWPGFLKEANRLVAPGGFLRFTEPTDFGLTNSPALNRLMELTRQALFQLGYGIAKDQNDLGVLPMLLAFFREHYQDITILTHTLDYSSKAEAWADTFHNIDVITGQMRPLLLKLSFVNEDTFDTFHRQAVIDMHSNAFCGISHLTTIVGKKPLQ